jgi:TP901 family phage tail tape measure protein
MATRFHIDAVFKALDKFSAPVARMTTRMDRFTRRIRKGMRGIGKMTKRMARGFRNSALTLGSLAVMGGFALKSMVGPAMRFQHAMHGVNAVTLGLYKEHMPALAKKAKHLGATTTFTATRVAAAMEILQRSSLDVAETLDTIEPVLRGAEAAGTSIETMADILVSTTKAMDQLEFADATDTVNAYAVAAANANTTIEKLGEGMVKAAPIANTLDIQFDHLLATVATLQDAGIEASMSGSQLRTMLTRLTALTPKAAKRFKALGIEVLDGNKNMLSMPQILANVAKGLAKVQGNAAKVADIQKAVGLRGAVAANLLVKSWEKGPSGGIQKIMGKIADRASDAAEQMSKMRLEGNLYGDLVRLKSAWEFFRIEVVSKSLPQLQEVVQSLTEWLLKPANIKAAAEKWDNAVTGLKAFWAQNGSTLISLAKTTFETAQLLMEAVLALARILPSAPEFLRGVIGTNLPEEDKRAIQKYEAGGGLPPGVGNTVTLQHGGQTHDVPDPGKAVLELVLPEPLTTKESGAEIGVGPFSVKVRQESSGAWIEGLVRSALE